MKNPGFGGEENPDRLETSVEKGEGIVVPAGVGHRLLEDLSGGFEMVGAIQRVRTGICAMRKRRREKSRELVDWAGLRKIPYLRVDQS